MTIEVLVILVFVAVAAAVVGLSMLMSGRSQVQREKAIQNRLQEVGGGAVAARGRRRRRRHAAAEGNRRPDAEHGSRRHRGVERFGRRAVAPAIGHRDDHQRRAS